MYVERAADEEMCIYCLGEIKFFILFSFYIFITIHFINMVLKESLEFFLHDTFWKAWKLPFISEIWKIYF